MYSDRKYVLYRELRRRGSTPRGAWRTLKRGADAVSLAVTLRDRLGEDTAVALVTGLLEAGYGAQRAANVLCQFLPEREDVWPGIGKPLQYGLPLRRCGFGIHAGGFYGLLRRVLKALPHIGEPTFEYERIVDHALVRVAVSRAERGDLRWKNRVYYPERGLDIETCVYECLPVRITLRRRYILGAGVFFPGGSAV
jgi:hypothetical protein